MADMTPLQFDLLTVLAEGRRHGYDLVGRVGHVSGKRPAVATLYAALHKLETVGYVSAAGDEISDGRVRRYFDLTEQGSVALLKQADAYDRRATAAKSSLRAASLRGRSA